MENNLNTELISQDNVTVSSEYTSRSMIVVASTMSPIIVLGTIGNVLSLLVWVKVRRCKSSTACFLASLAIADSVALLTAGLNFWMQNVVQTDLRFRGVFACKFLVYVDFAAQFASAWIIALVTAGRTFAVLFPHKYKKACRPLSSLVFTVLTVLVMLLICLPFLLSAEIQSVMTKRNSTMEVCLFTNGSTLVKHEVTWFYVELLVHFVIPFVIIIICNICILVITTSLAVKRWRSLRNIGRLQADHTCTKDGKMLKTVTVRIILLSLAFCLGVGPIHLYRYKATLQVVQINDGNNSKTTDSLYVPFTILMYLNNAVNFLLYCLIGSSFRKDLLKLVGRRTSASSVTRTT